MAILRRRLVEEADPPICGVPTKLVHAFPTACAELARLGFVRLSVVARGVDTRRFDPARRDAALRAQWGAAADDPVLLHVGRIAAEKNLGTLFAAYEEARRRAPRARLVLVGDGPMRAELKARCPDAVFAGRRIGDDLARHFASADIFLFPSLTETYGNVTLEAMASGLAVVAFGYAAATEVLEHGTSGVLAAYGDDASFVSQARRSPPTARGPRRSARMRECPRSDAPGVKSCATSRRCSSPPRRPPTPARLQVTEAGSRSSVETGSYSGAGKASSARAITSGSRAIGSGSRAIGSPAGRSASGHRLGPAHGSMRPSKCSTTPVRYRPSRRS